MMIDKISLEEKAIMEKYIYQYISRDVPKEGNRASIDYILRFWDHNKESLFNLFNRNLILSKRVSYVKDYDELYDDMSNVIFHDPHRDEKVKEFIRSYRALEIVQRNYDLEYLLTVDNLVNNEWKRNESFSVELADGKTLKIQKGSKIIKSISKIAKAYNLPYFEDFRIAHSMVLNQKKLTGNLCISIHPLDYMTMSDNNCNWDSCMTWTDFGDYRRGTVEMMNSPYIVVAYLTADSDYEIVCNHYWNNKKWRQLFIVSPEMISGIKGYPYCNQYLEKEVATWIRELAINNLGWDFYDSMDKWSNNNVVAANHGVYKVKTYTNAMYNDCGANQMAYFSPSTPSVYAIELSGESECMWCGEVSNGFNEADCLVCDACDNGTVCEYCGDIIRYEEDVLEIDGRIICRDCYENYVLRCDSCDDDVFEEDIVHVYASVDDGESVLRNAISTIGICRKCLNDWLNGDEYFVEKYGHIYEKKLFWYRKDYYFVANEKYKKKIEDFLPSIHFRCFELGNK